MPLTPKGEEILKSMEKTYGSEEKAKEVLYASKNAGKITGIDGEDKGQQPARPVFPGQHGEVPFPHMPKPAPHEDAAYRQAGDQELSLTDIQEQNKKFWEQSAAKGQQVDAADDAVEMPGGFSPNLPEGYPSGPSATADPSTLGNNPSSLHEDSADDYQTMNVNVRRNEPGTKPISPSQMYPSRFYQKPPAYTPLQAHKGDGDDKDYPASPASVGAEHYGKSVTKTAGMSEFQKKLLSPTGGAPSPRATAPLSRFQRGLMSRTGVPDDKEYPGSPASVGAESYAKPKAPTRTAGFHASPAQVGAETYTKTQKSVVAPKQPKTMVTGPLGDEPTGLREPSSARPPKVNVTPWWQGMHARPLDDNEEALEEAIHPGLHEQLEALKTAGKQAEGTEYEPAGDHDIMVHDPSGFQVTGDRDGDELKEFGRERDLVQFLGAEAQGPTAAKIGSHQVEYGTQALTFAKQFHPGGKPLTPGYERKHDEESVVGSIGEVGEAFLGGWETGQKFGETVKQGMEKVSGDQSPAGAAPAVSPTDQGMHPALSLAQRARGTVKREKHNKRERDEKDFVTKTGEATTPPASSDEEDGPVPLAQLMPQSETYRGHLIEHVPHAQLGHSYKMGEQTFPSLYSAKTYVNWMHRNDPPSDK